MPAHRTIRTIAVIAVLLACAKGALAEAPGSIVVHVRDAQSKAPVPGARVVIRGAFPSSTVADPHGDARFDNLPSGAYNVEVLRPGYTPQRSADFESQPGGVATIDVVLGRAGMRVIGSVATRSSRTSPLAPSSALRQTSDDYVGALDKLPGVHVDGDAAGIAPITVSTRNRESSQTAVTYDGVPIGPVGSSANLRSLGMDVVSGASLSLTGGAFPGGMLSLSGPVPTVTRTLGVSSRLTTAESNSLSARGSGGVGKLAVAVQHSSRQDDSPLGGLDFTDASGQTYVHDGRSVQSSDLFKVRYRFSDSLAMNAATVVSNGRYAELCTQDATILPCGFGAGNVDYDRYQLHYATVTAGTSAVLVSVTPFATRNVFRADESTRTVGGVAAPSASSFSIATSGLSATVSASSGRHALELSALSEVSHYDYRVVPDPLLGTAVGAQSWSQLRVGDFYRVSDPLALRASMAAQNAGGLSGFTGTFGATYRSRGGDVADLSASFGGMQPTLGVGRALAAPQSAQFDCSAGTTVISGPAAAAQPQSQREYDFSVQHRMGRDAIGFDVYDQRQSGQPATFLTSAADDASLVNGAYLSALASVWSRRGICAGTPFSAAGLYVSRVLSGTQRRYRGFDISARFELGKALAVVPVYSVNSATLTSSDARLSGPNGLYAPGLQLLGKPLHRAGLTITADKGRSWQYALAAQWTSANNARYLPSFTTVDAALSHVTGGVRTTLTATNLFGTLSGAFATNGIAFPVTTNAHGAVLFPGVPLPGRRLTLSISAAVGTLSTDAARPDAVAPPSARFRLPVPAPHGTDPLALNVAQPECDADAQHAVRPFFDDLASFVTAYRAKRPVPSVRDMDVVPVEAPGTSWFDIRAKADPAARARFGRGQLFACAYATFYTQAQAQAHGVDAAGRAVMGYAPELGLFFVQAAPGASARAQ